MSDYLTAGDLGQPSALRFRATADNRQLAADIRQLQELWGRPVGGGQIDRDDWERAWRNIGVLASRLFDTINAQGRCDDEAFHNLLLAVGNFKRQAGGIHLRVDLVAPMARSQTEKFFLPGNLGELGRDNIDSWHLLQRIPGLGIPTASCLLSALWPDEHVIIDVRDRRWRSVFRLGSNPLTTDVST